MEICTNLVLQFFVVMESNLSNEVQEEASEDE